MAVTVKVADRAGAVTTSVVDYAVAAPFSTRFGMSVRAQSGETLPQAVARLRAQFGALPAVRVFQTGGPVGAWAGNAILAALKDDTQVVAYSAKGTLADYANGRYASTVNGLLSTIPSWIEGFYFTVWHEPEDDIEKGAFTYADLKAAQRGIAPVVAGYSRAHLTFTGMTWTLERGSNRDWRNYVSDAVEHISWDRYNGAWDGSPPKYRAPADLFQPAVDIANLTGLGWSISEFGSPRLIDGSDPDGTGRAAWLRESADWCRANGARYVTYWNRAALSGSASYELDDAASIQAWRAQTAG